MNKEELKLLDELKEHCLKQAMYTDPYAMKKYKMFEMMELKIYELEKEIKHLLDLQKSMDKQYSDLEHNWNELKEYLKDYKDVLENQKDSVEGLDLFEEHTLDTLEEVLNEMQSLEDGGNNE